MDVYIIRHGETAFNEGEERIRGRKDVPLSKLGLKHVEEVGKALSEVPIETIYHSQLSRTKDTAAGIKNYQDSSLLLEEPYLLDISFGDWEGKTGKEVFQGELHDKWRNNPHDVLIPGGETFFQVLDRIHRLFIRLREQKEKSVVLVSHGAVINLIFVYLTETHPSHYWDFYVKPCSISHVKLYPNGKINIVKFNDFSHLSQE
ncbi:MAG: histidine phosphatase family protein [Candidatus Heimdallarchaeota archaeon]|nr:histidine phosphatase family protein [Candidatus Heimdallarchaeota archaeon]